METKRQTNGAYGNGNAQGKCRRQHHHRNVFSYKPPKAGKDVYMPICPNSSQQSAHFQFQPHPAEGRHSETTSDKQNKTRRREESIPLHIPRLSRIEAIRATRTTHDDGRYEHKGPRHIYDESERHNGRWIRTTKANDTADTMDKKKNVAMAKS